MGDIGGEEPGHWNAKGQEEKILVSVRLRPSDVKKIQGTMSQIGNASM